MNTKEMFMIMYGLKDPDQEREVSRESEADIDGLDEAEGQHPRDSNGSSEEDKRSERGTKSSDESCPF